MEALGGAVLVGGFQHIGGYDVGRIELSLIAKCRLLSIGKLAVSCAIRGIFLFGDDTTDGIVLLTIQTGGIGRIGRTVLVVAGFY